jgi:micrococcal nuclease
LTSRRAFALALAATAAGCGRGVRLDGLIAGEEGVVAQARSGDVLILDDGLEIRLAGLDAPNGDEPLAAEARGALSQLAQGRQVRLFYGGLKRDRYERALAHVRLADGRAWLQGRLLEAGWARVRTYSDNRAMAAEMLQAEARARVAGRGLWALDRYRVLLPPECRGRFGFQIAEGRAAGVREAGGAARLEFAGDGLAVDIPVFARSDFEAAGLAPDTLTGRLLRVRGILNGGLMRLDHPEAMELLRES